jgi:AP-1 complex subunit sigma 1/2
LLLSRQGKIRLAKWYTPYKQKDKARMIRETTGMILPRSSDLCNFLDYKEGKLIYKRYASLYFVAYCDLEDNELMVLEIIHHYVEILDRYFGNVCELDLIFNFDKAHYILDELMVAGELLETSKKTILRACTSQDELVEEQRTDKKKRGKDGKTGSRRS